MELLPSQIKIIEDVFHWLYHESGQVYEISGLAGTGKSLILFEAVRHLCLGQNEILPMAFTGQAASVMRKKGFVNAVTLHSGLFKVIKIPKNRNMIDPFDIEAVRHKRIKDNPEDEYVTRFVELSPLELVARGIRLIVIDEAYMVPKYMRNAIFKHGIKILVAGDTHQLDPIGDDPLFFTYDKARGSELTEIMRQDKDNPIIYLSHRVLDGLPIDDGMYGNKVLVVTEGDIPLEQIIRTGNIVCGLNKTREYFNQITRRLYHLEHNQLYYGEKVICRKNNWDQTSDSGSLSLTNGLIGYIDSPISGSSYEVKNGIHTSIKTMSINESFSDLYLNKEYLFGSYEERERIRNKPLEKTGKLNLFEFAYANTCHLSQGAEFPFGVYYKEYMNDNINNRLDYVGITRFQDYLLIVKKKYNIYWKGGFNET